MATSTQLHAHGAKMPSGKSSKKADATSVNKSASKRTGPKPGTGSIPPDQVRKVRVVHG